MKSGNPIGKMTGLCMIGIIFFTISCNSNSHLEHTLEQAGERRAELEKVLSHYENDSLKKQAAEFLISNLVGNVAYDTTLLYKYRPVLLHYDSLKKVEKSLHINAKDSLNKEWKKFLRYNDPRTDIYSRLVSDLSVVSADYLIENIDLAFQSWEQCLYKDSIPFNIFLKYVLPYRRNNGYVVEKWRNYFISRYGDYMLQYSSPHQLVDSLLEQFNDYQVDWSDISTYPNVCLQDYHLSKMSRCPARCWFNSMLLSALGVPCTIDFVPAWGNRNSSHEWNAIVVNGKTYPFEATGGRGKWKAGKVYNNVWVDEYWMKSRLPKVFRYSYETMIQGPSSGKGCNAANTPVFFRNTKYEDVSDAYFVTSDIHIPIKKGIKLEGVEYAYLCVFNEDVWKPVFWGEVGISDVSFCKMGRDMVYLPVFYKDGKSIPFNDPFILQADGSILFLKADAQRTESVALKRKYYARPDIGFWCEWNKGAQFEISQDRAFHQSQIVFTVPECESRPNVWQLDTSVKCRYIRYVFPEDKDVLAELSFYEKSEGKEQLQRLTGVPFSSDESRMKTLSKLFDNDILTFADLNPYLSEKDSIGWVGVDFGKEVEVSALGVCPRNDKNNVIQGMAYELFYWGGSWISLGKKMATDYLLNYDNVPSNALLFLKCTTEGKENRIFTWEDNKQRWW